MKNRADEYVRNLKNQYLFQVKKFIDALKGNASQKELISIRKNIKDLSNEIRKCSETENSFYIQNRQNVTENLPNPFMRTL